MSTLGMLLEIAIRNVFANRWKTLIVGGVTGLGALVLVVGGAISGSIDRAMERSITRSFAGHIQVYSARSTGPLELLGGLGGEASPMAPIDDFAKLQREIMKVPNVNAVVPMGFSDALASGENPLDQALGDLRQDATALEEGDNAKARTRYEAAKDSVRYMMQLLQSENETVRLVSDATAEREAVSAIARANSSEFWRDFDAEPFSGLDFLESNVAPLAGGGDVLPLRFMGTDPALFQRTFKRMRVVTGERIPAGARGFMFSHLVYENGIKIRAARGLDQLKRMRDEQQAQIALDPDLKRLVADNVAAVDEVVLQLGPGKMTGFRDKLQGFLRSDQAKVGVLLKEFFRMDDANFEERFAFFYQQLAPDLKLYKVGVGDDIVLKTFTRAGDARVAKLKVYGTFDFEGLEKSPQAGSINMVDLVSFRELYGFKSAELEREVKAMRAAAGVVSVSKDAAERELFGKQMDLTTETVDGADEAGGIVPAPDAFAQLRGTRALLLAKQATRYDPKELREGQVLNAAVVVNDDAKIESTMALVGEASRKAALDLRVVSWRDATGLVGQFMSLIGWVLFAAVSAIFFVALIVMNSASVMATLDRVGEIGMFRAIGATRNVVFSMVLIESTTMGLLFGTLGAVLGTLIVVVVGDAGIPAWTDAMAFFFAGDHLYPGISPLHIVLSLSVVTLVSVVAGAYPALLATSVSPREAMHSRE